MNLPEVKAWTVVALAADGKDCGILLVALGPLARCSGMSCPGMGGKGGLRCSDWNDSLHDANADAID